MKRMAMAGALAILVLLMAMPTAGAADTGMEGLWTGSTGGGQLTLLLGSGGTFISIFDADVTYRQAGSFDVDTDYMYLTMSDGSSATLQYGFSGGVLALYGDGLDAELRRIDYAFEDGLTGVWVVSGTGVDPGLAAMDGKGGFASIDATSGESAKGIYLPNQGDLLVAYQDGTSMQMAYRLNAGNDKLTLNNPDTGATVTLTRYASKASDAPNAFEAPNATAEPKASGAPGIFGGTPKATAAPDATGAPEASEAPETTE
jgi:hypothetical protein